LIFEVAELTVKPGNEMVFEQGVSDAVPLFLNAIGCRGVELHKVVEQASVYRLIVNWNSLEDHTIGFRGSADFQKWRDLVGRYFAEPPRVTHTSVVSL
jgi:heme-degrading monooxygenase HmoA